MVSAICQVKRIRWFGLRLSLRSTNWNSGRNLNNCLHTPLVTIARSLREAGTCPAPQTSNGDRARSAVSVSMRHSPSLPAPKAGSQKPQASARARLCELTWTNRDTCGVTASHEEKWCCELPRVSRVGGGDAAHRTALSLCPDVPVHQAARLTPQPLRKRVKGRGRRRTEEGPCGSPINLQCQ